MNLVEQRSAADLELARTGAAPAARKRDERHEPGDVP
jgi:hypothetical protein